MANHPKAWPPKSAPRKPKGTKPGTKARSTPAGAPGFLTLRSGILRGKRLPVPSDGSVRPTSDRHRGQAFDLIDQHFRHPDGRARWQGACILDAFAGTGALGLEAVGRGAAQAYFWDISSAQVQRLKKTIQSFALKNVQVEVQNALHAPPRSTSLSTPSAGAMDLIFLDPPYDRDLARQALAALGGTGWIGPETLIYMETEITCPSPPDMDILAERRSAATCLRLLKKTA